MARKRKSSIKVLGWHVVSVHQFAEFEAKRELTKQGYEAEFPMIRSATYDRFGARKTLPLFEGYVFVRESDQWWSIKGTRGVSHLLMDCERPAILADDELQFFLSVSVDDHGHYVDPVMPVFKLGEKYFPRLGRFRGHAGKLTDLSADGRTEMLFTMMGRRVRTREYRVQELA